MGAAISFLAALQFAAVLSSRGGASPLPLLEYDMSHNPLRAALYDPRPDCDGMIAIPDGPGLGIEIEIERLSEYVTDHWVLE